MKALDTLAARQARDAGQRRRLDDARRAIRLGKQRVWIMREFELSATAYEQLAGQVRSGWQA